MSRMDRIDEERLNHALALHAKLLCSGVFVVGREPEELIANERSGRSPRSGDTSTEHPPPDESPGQPS